VEALDLEEEEVEALDLVEEVEVLVSVEEIMDKEMEVLALEEVMEHKEEEEVVGNKGEVDHRPEEGLVVERLVVEALKVKGKANRHLTGKRSEWQMDGKSFQI